ncbi:universal stress protein [Neptunitalea lumnitzerae]|uniref:UspA domain-containing protein n=1 Tax=Neptunitalea lumnitzerae TaxID=2965509 RepID=A0ABQ5MIF9_9FLAO|nr:universal stress protein [Neptunitalea sp. Y10]GLB49200.1 hypothetical protein Y10_15680 [Neptunitalea sp. Y10]
MNKILYATDYSKNSVSALKYANYLSEVTGASLTVLNILEYPTIWNSDVPKPAFEDFEKGPTGAYKKLLSEFCEQHLGKEKADKIIFDTEKGDDIEETLKAYVLKNDFDAILLGVHGMNPVQEFFMGSTTQSLISSIDIPVIAVPETAALKDFKTAVFATSLDTTDVSTIKKVVPFLKEVGATLKVVHIAEKKTDEKLKSIAAFMELLNDDVDYATKTFDVVYNEDILRGLFNFIDAQKADLIIMKERKVQSKLRELFHKDLVKRMESQTRIPLMSIK